MTYENADHTTTIARNVRFFRMEKKLTLDELACLTSISPVCLFSIENGDVHEELSHEQIDSLAATLGISVGALTGSDDDFYERLNELQNRVRNGRYSESDVSLANAILKETKHRGPEDQYKTLHLRGVLSYLRGEYQAAYLYYQAAIDLAKRCGIEQQLLWELKTYRINALLQMGRYDELYALGTHLIEQMEHPVMRARVLYTLGVSFYNKGQYDAAITHINRAIEYILDTEQNRVFLSRCYAALATTYQRSQRLEQAVVNSEKALELAKIAGDELCEVYALSVLGDVMLDQGDVQKAQEYFLDALEIAERNADRKLEQILMQFSLARCKESPFLVYEAMESVLDRVEEVELSPRDLAEMYELAAKEAFTIGRYASGQRHHEAAIRTLRTIMGRGNEEK